MSRTAAADLAAARLIALDWGTSNLRASLLGEGGCVLAARAAPGGVMAVQDGRFEEALRELAGDWIDGARCPLVASGMVGSRQGWREAPYVECPAGLAEVAERLVRVALAHRGKGAGAPNGTNGVGTKGAVLHIVPGLACTRPDVGGSGTEDHADVMRGEETQLFGAALAPGECCVLPGTHSKWAWLDEDGDEDDGDIGRDRRDRRGGRGARIRTFSTYMTGELYAVLTQHSILGRGMVAGQARPEAFAAGVRLGLAEHADATHVLFAARTAGLTGRIAPEGLPDYLSGLLIGIEIGSATRRAGAVRAASVVLLGEPALVARYETALTLAGIGHRRACAEATTRGQWLVAEAAGLLAANAQAAGGAR